MPVAYAFDDRVIVVRAEGNYSPDDLKRSVLDALDDARCPARPVLLFDLRASASLEERTAGEVQDMAEFLATHSARFGHRLAMVVSSDVGYGLMRMGSVHAERGGVRPAVFRDLAQAREWLRSP